MPGGKRGLEDKQGGGSHRGRGQEGGQRSQRTHTETRLPGKASCSQAGIIGGGWVGRTHAG